MSCMKKINPLGRAVVSTVFADLLISSRRSAALLALGVALSLTAGATAQTSAVPSGLSYQGKVSNANGTLVGAGTPVNRLVIFRVWSHATNSTLTDLVFSEQQTVTISEGEFSVILGQGVTVSGTPLGYSESTKGTPTVLISSPTTFGGATRYLGVTVDDGSSDTADPEASPRQQLVTSAYAFRAKYAETVGANGANSLTALDNGNVGIGNTTPSEKLHVNGNALVSGTGSFTGALSTGSNLSVTGTAAVTGTSTFTGASTFNGSVRIASSGSTPMSFGSWFGTKISLLDNLGDSSTIYGFGIQSNTLQVFTPGAGNDIALGYGPSASMTETMRVKGNGNVGIGTSSPAQKLSVSGDTLTTGTAYLLDTNHSIRAISNSGVAISAYGATDGIILKQTTGNVGIGTTSPSQKLEVNGTVKATTFTGNGTIPIGGIIMWSGTTTDIPVGWTLCNGTSVNSLTVPDLRDRFIVGAGSAYNPKAIGGATSHTLAATNLPTHTIPYKDIYHSEKGGTVIVGSALNTGLGSGWPADADNSGWEISRTATYTGTATAINHLPPYMALCYIMRVL